MSDIHVPHAYEELPLEMAGKILRRTGSKALIIGGKRALQAAGQKLEHAMKAEEVRYTTHILEGEPTVEKVYELSRIGLLEKSDFVIGVGGGKAIDISKAVSNELHVPLVTVPTIAATCAAWTSVYLLYSQDHKVDRHEWMENVVETILVDKSIILAAPERYLYSGIGDSTAKWYEECHPTDNIDESQIDLLYRLRRRIASLSRDFLEQEFLDSVGNNPDDDANLKNEAVDAIFILAGLPVGFRPTKPSKAVPRLELAHAFYNSWTWVPKDAKLLHGEVVSFGVAVQLAFQTDDLAVVRKYLKRIHHIGLPVTLKEVGLNNEQKIIRLANYVINGIPGYSNPYETLNVGKYVAAIHTVDGIGLSL